MFGLIIFIHVVACILLISIILMQSGRGGGLTENFAPAESLFGAKTNIVLVKATAVLAGIFIVSCLSLAFFSTTRNRSLMEQVPAKATAIPPDTSSANQEVKSPAAETEQKQAEQKPAEATQQSDQPEPEAVQKQPQDSGQNANP